MKNEEHEKLVNTINKCNTDTEDQIMKSKAINTLSTEIMGLTKEIQNTRIGFRYLHDFEKYPFKNVTNTAEYVIEDPKIADQRLYYDFSAKIKYEDIVSRYNEIHKEKENNQFISNNLFARKSEDRIKRSIVEKTHEFYISASNMPLRYILENTNKVVFTNEMIFAHEESKIIKKLRKIKSEKLRNRLFISEVDLINHADNVDRKKIICKILADLCKEFVEQNSIYINGDRRLLFGSVKVFTTKKYTPKIRNPYEKNHAGVFELINKNKSLIRFPIQQPKKFISAQHTSHLNIIRRIQPELSKIQTPSGILEYKNKVKNKSIGMAAPFRKEMISNGKVNITDNVTYSVRSEMRKR